ncbi:MAG: hypothetical protein ABSC21_15455 [Terriglobia bacterium]|jgi:hypothetical protein
MVMVGGLQDARRAAHSALGLFLYAARKRGADKPPQPLMKVSFNSHTLHGTPLYQDREA